MKKLFDSMHNLRQILVVLLILQFVGHSQSQIGDIIWKENFNNLDSWIKETGNGS